MPEQDPAPDFFDLKMLPAWATETPNENRYANFAGEESGGPRDRDRRGGDRHERGPRPPRRDGPGRREGAAPRDRRGPARAPAPRPPREENFGPAPQVDVRFVPDGRALEAVLAQIKAGHVAYSVFSLARMFLEKPERYDVRLQVQSGPLFQIGEKGAVASDRRLLENGAFPQEKDNFYRVEVVQTEPIKGNFTSVARDRLSGTLLGPTNHHAYQSQLRALYEERFSRRMSFPDYQRQIEIVSDPEAVERWKEEARSVTTYTTSREEPPVTFQNAAETERHFRQNYLPGLIRELTELTVDGAVSRRLGERALGRVIEDAWARETRSPSKMMQELIAAFPANGLHLFRHRKAMLFVSPVRPRPFAGDSISLSPSIATILRLLGETPGMSRKQLLEKISPPPENAEPPEELDRKKLALASDLRWLVSEGHVIEFNDGTLDLARTKAPRKIEEKRKPAEAPAAAPEEPSAAASEEVSSAAPEEAVAVELEEASAAPAEESPAAAREETPTASIEEPPAVPPNEVSPESDGPSL